MAERAGGATKAGGFLESRRLVEVLFAVYLAVLVWIILFKMQFSLDVFGTLRSVNLVPFAGALFVNGAADYSEVVQNVLVFVPFGLYLGMLVEGRLVWAKLAPVFAVSLSLELMQFVFAAGATDVTDLLANTLGGAVGLGLFACARWVAGSDVRALRACNAAALACTVLFIGFFALVLAANA